jgi:hypothetical protein
MRHLLLGLVLFCLLASASCVPVPAQRGWVYEDLRLLDPAGDVPVPSADILAVYTRTSGSDFEIRLDMLDVPLTPDYELLIYITPAPFNTDPADRAIEISIPPAGKPGVFTNNPTLDAEKIIPRVVRDPWLDTVVVGLNKLYLPADFKIDILSLQVVPGQANPPIDYATNISLHGSPPLARAPLLLAFWDTFPAATSAQALRRWDGAHSGPRGERHGLKHIVDNAEAYGVPVALLDLKTPASLAALDYMGLTTQIRNLAALRLLLLPDVAYAEPANVSLDFCRRAAAGFGLPASQFVYNASSRFQSTYLAQFYPLEDATHLSRSGNTRLIPLPAADEVQATTDGLSIEARKALVDVALSADPSDLVVLGGDLPLSTWGNENMAGPTFAWIAAHPWIQPLTGEDLLTFPLKAPSINSILLPTPIEPSVALIDPSSGPQNALMDLAWQTYLTLHIPSGDAILRSLRAHYTGQVGALLAAASWAENPSAYPGQENDINKYSDHQYALSSKNLFAIIDNKSGGAILTNLFYIDGAGLHQFIAPSSQFTVGLSDPSEWKLDLGDAADPSVVPGAFSDGTDTWVVRQPVTSERIAFTTPDGSQIKTYSLIENGVEISYQGTDAVNTRIPLAVDPQAFYFGPAHYQSTLTVNSWSWRLENGVGVEVRTDSAFSAQSFTDSLAFLSQPEDPDRAYPPGHYQPFPLSVVTIQGNGDCSVQISVK